MTCFGVPHVFSESLCTLGKILRGGTDKPSFVQQCSLVLIRCPSTFMFRYCTLECYVVVQERISMNFFFFFFFFFFVGLLQIGHIDCSTGR